MFNFNNKDFWKSFALSIDYIALVAFVFLTIAGLVFPNMILYARIGVVGTFFTLINLVALNALSQKNEKVKKETKEPEN